MQHQNYTYIYKKTQFTKHTQNAGSDPAPDSTNVSTVTQYLVDFDCCYLLMLLCCHKITLAMWIRLE